MTLYSPVIITLHDTLLTCNYRRWLRGWVCWATTAVVIVSIVSHLTLLIIRDSLSLPDKQWQNKLLRTVFLISKRNMQTTSFRLYFIVIYSVGLFLRRWYCVNCTHSYRPTALRIKLLDACSHYYAIEYCLSFNTAKTKCLVVLPKTGSDVNKTATPKNQDKAKTSPLKTETKAKPSSSRPRQGQDTNQHDQDKTRPRHCNTKQDQGKTRTKMQTKIIVTHVFSLT